MRYRTAWLGLWKGNQEAGLTEPTRKWYFYKLNERMDVSNKMMKWRKRILTGIVALISCTMLLLAQGPKPYLQSPSDTSVWVSWKTSSGTASLVKYGIEPGNLSMQATGDCQVLSDVGYDNNYFYHSVQLTGLQPGEAYYYKVITGTQESSVYRFRAQPSPGTGPGIFRFLVLGDHQVLGSGRYEMLVTMAREKIIELYGENVEDHVNLVINDGDQVDQGTLEQYEFMHFEPSAILSGNIPVMTTMGNHETYGTLGLQAYYPHFFYDKLGYKGIESPGGENYYAYVLKNILFVHLSSEHTDEDQVGWVNRLVDSAMNDPGIEWIISIGHRPIQAEQYVGDISVYIRDRIIPVLARTEKSALFISGHHHLYARGQVRDYPMYHIISGGASWDQFWGQSVEKDFDDVQKTIDYWTYQIVTIDPSKKEMVADCYAVGSPHLGFTLDNIKIDSFYRRFPGLPPSMPSIQDPPADSISLPYTFVSSSYSSAGPEPYNSVQFQIDEDPGFNSPFTDLIRDYENLYGTTGSPSYLPVDIHDTVDIFRYTLRKHSVPNGSYNIRVRHRDRNLTWSDWSDHVPFDVKGSTGGFISISTDKNSFLAGEDIEVHYFFGPGNPGDWIGIYRAGDTPGPIPSTDWEYVSGTTGTVTLNVDQPGEYFIAFFEDEGYYEMAERLTVFITSIPELSLEKGGFDPGESFTVSYESAPGLPNDWIGIYRLDDVPGQVASTLWYYTSGSSGSIDFEGLQAGYYFLAYFLVNGYDQAGERLYFSVGSELAELTTDKSDYSPGEEISVDYSNSPGLSTDWIGIFNSNAQPGTAPLVSRKFAPGTRSGTVVFENTPSAGSYFAAMFINNSSARISNRIEFTVGSTGGLEPYNVSQFNMVITGTVEGKLKITGYDPGKCDGRLLVCSLEGRLFMEIPARNTDGLFEEHLDISAYPQGIYIIRYLSLGVSHAMKCMIH